MATGVFEDQSSEGRHRTIWFILHLPDILCKFIIQRQAAGSRERRAYSERAERRWSPRAPRPSGPLEADMMALYKFVQAGQAEGQVYFREELVSFLLEERPNGVLFEEDGLVGDIDLSFKKVGDVRKGKISFTSTHSLFD